MSYRNSGLVDISLNVDLSALESRLDEISEREDALDEDRVRDIFRELAHDEGEDMVRDVISTEGYVLEDDVDQKIRDALSDYPDEDRVSVLIDDAIRDADNADVSELQRKVDDLERRFELYATRVDDLMQDMRKQAERIDTFEQDTPLTPRVEALERDLATLNEASGKAISLFELLRRAVEILIGR